MTFSTFSFTLYICYGHILSPYFCNSRYSFFLFVIWVKGHSMDVDCQFILVWIYIGDYNIIPTETYRLLDCCEILNIDARFGNYLRNLRSLNCESIIISFWIVNNG